MVATFMWCGGKNIDESFPVRRGEEGKMAAFLQYSGNEVICLGHQKSLGQT